MFRLSQKAILFILSNGYPKILNIFSKVSFQFRFQWFWSQYHNHTHWNISKNEIPTFEIDLSRIYRSLSTHCPCTKQKIDFNDLKMMMLTILDHFRSTIYRLFHSILYALKVILLNGFSLQGLNRVGEYFHTKYYLKKKKSGA